MNEKDIELVLSMIRDMGNRCKLIMNLIPNESGETLRHLAASTIHLVIFMKDFDCFINNKKHKEIGEVIEFLENCGCDFYKKESER